MMEWILTSSVLILVVTALRTVLKGKLSLRLQYALWGLVLVRLLLPISLFDSSFSVMSALEHAAPTLTQDTGDVVLGYRDYITPDLSVVEPDPNAPLEEQEKQYEENLSDWKAEIEAVKAETGTPVTVADIAKTLKTVWLTGTAAVALWFLAVNLRFGIKLRNERTAVSVEDYPLPVYRSAQVETPCLFGLLRPAVYLTDEVTEEDALRHVLAHELTHYRHRDHMWSALRALCLALHWYNPLVWLAACLSRRDAELACDEGTLKRIGEEQRAAYGRTLIGLTCRRRSAAALSLTATTMTGSKKGIAERILLIAKKPQMKKWTLAVLLVLVIVAAGCTFSSADKTGAPEPDEAGRTWSITLIQTDWSSEMMFSDVELQTPSGELCIQNRNLFPVYVELYHGNVVVLEDTIQPGGQCIFKQAYEDVSYKLAAQAEVESGTEIHLKIYDGDAEQEPYTLPQPAEPDSNADKEIFVEPEDVQSWADWSEEDIARWDSEVQWMGLAIQTDATDYAEIGRAFAEAFVAQFLNTSDDHPARCTDVAVVNCEFGNESLTSQPKELIFGIYFARKPVNEQELINWSHGWAEPLEERLYPEYGEGWYGDGRYFTLEQATDGSWVCTEVGTGGYGGWGYLNYYYYYPEDGFESDFESFLIGEEGDREPEIMLMALPLLSWWDTFDERWGEQGREGLWALLDKVCVGENRVYGPEDTRMWYHVYPDDQLYRDLYVMLAAVDAGGDFAEGFRTVLLKQQAYDPAVFSEALAQLPAEQRTFVENLIS